MANGSNSNRLLRIGELVKDSICANPQRVQATQLASKRVSGMRFALEQPQRILDCVDQGPAEFEQLPPCATGKNEPCQRSAGGGSTLSQLAAKLGEGDRFVAGDLAKARLQRGEDIGVGEDLSRLLQCLVLVDRHQGRGRSAVASYKHVIAPIADIVEQATQVAT